MHLGHNSGVECGSRREVLNVVGMLKPIDPLYNGMPIHIYLDFTKTCTQEFKMPEL